ncbi:YdeI/OmpD-associated family protein [Winogradskyella luteola]|uniref:YdeI/OmpD-associated family protein n=1 Tax=Winogradskyella luteola TaxID=2828330 RepID=A0A9X1F7J8_9FLAO|nr:YdeI/OmpD-associated family protein [Winogradskyella luteola]MBV7268581.1 YdeI/OmpD-associated family protein [Winogradskyella luteola]
MLKSKPFEVSLADKQSVILPDKHITEFIENKHKRIKVKASSPHNEIEFYAALKREKSGLYRMYFSKAKQKELEVFMNDYFTIQVFEDTSKYGVEMSEELKAVLLSDYEAYTIFEDLTPGRQRSIIYTISRYKSSQKRIDKAILLTENLKRGVKDPKLWLKKF